MDEIRKVYGWFFLGIVLIGVAARVALEERKLKGFAILRFLVLGYASALVMEGLVLVFLPLHPLTHDALIVISALAGAEIIEGLYIKTKRDGLRAVIADAFGGKNNDR